MKNVNIAQVEHVYIIAELSANHNNDLNLAIKTIEEIAKSGADAVKIQTYTADSLALNVDNEYFGPKQDGLWKGRRPYELYQEASLPYEWHPILQKAAVENKLDFFSSPFDFEAVNFLHSLDVPKYKIASFEINDIPLIEYAAAKQKPMIISTGLAEYQDIENAIAACIRQNNSDITILKCTSNYPSHIKDANLATMVDMKNKFGVDVGVSDHTFGHIVPVTATALGASVIEKHYILERSLGGPDSKFSMEPDEFKFMVKSVRETSASIGNISYDKNEKDLSRRRSLFITKDIKKNELFSSENVRSIRPGAGLPPSMITNIIGKAAKHNLLKGEPLKLDDILDII